MSILSPRPQARLIRTRISIDGIVQGVGFRPYIYNLARSQGA